MCAWTQFHREPIIIIGAAGRDFHNFNTVFRDDDTVRVVAFTAAQIPGIDGRIYPPQLAGGFYPNGISIVSEEELEDLIRKHGVQRCIFAYSDVTHGHVMQLAERVNAAGASFQLLPPQQTWLHSSRPVISICAMRTGCGKSQTSRYIAAILRHMGLAVVAIRHPMPYDDDLVSQAVQRFARAEDLARYRCTIEEMEEYEPHIAAGGVIYSGVDYAAILAQAEQEAHIIIWDGGNNDTPFIQPDLHIVVMDPLRAGDEQRYYPSGQQMRLDVPTVFVINKCDSARLEQILAIEQSIRRVNPEAKIVRADSPVTVDNSNLIRGKRVLVVEDGPTCTHGGMNTGAGTVAANHFGATKIVDPRPYLKGELATTFVRYPDIGCLLPAMGYSEQQVQDLAATINAMFEAGVIDAVVSGTPIDLGRVIEVNGPLVRVTYNLGERLPGTLEAILRGHFGALVSK
ncbi:MAG: cyclic 2,3-diphosphoglycerate synthase [Patescibacteria group bacterium]